jgi:hypothetical protein
MMMVMLLLLIIMMMMMSTMTMTIMMMAQDLRFPPSRRLSVLIVANRCLSSWLAGPRPHRPRAGGAPARAQRLHLRHTKGM